MKTFMYFLTHFFNAPLGGDEVRTSLTLVKKRGKYYKGPRLDRPH